MNTAVVLIFATAGYVSGFSTASGFVFNFLGSAYVNGKPLWRALVWGVAYAVNTISAVMTPFFMLAVFNDKFREDEWWSRAAIYAAGFLVGVALVFFAGALINRYLERVRLGQEDPRQFFKN